MLITLRTTQQLADRIQRAYQRHRPRWRQVGQSPGVWTVAAATLLQAHQDDPLAPIDPELYVAAQMTTSPIVDPWGELAQEGAIRRYHSCVHQIIDRLRKELHAEVRLVRRRVRQGEPLEEVLRANRRALSPLGRFIAAYRASRPDLAEPFRAEAVAQHRSCPLYRPASRTLLSPEVYPAGHIGPWAGLLGLTDDRSFCWN